MRSIGFKLALLVSSSALSLFFAEGLARVITDPVNYLRVEPVADSTLMFRLKSGTSGHDSWGFRNLSVPDSVDIVAIGDSQTYGTGVVASRSWPARLQQMTGKSVYNLGIGGYGPIQYRYLLEHEALDLKPSVAVVGLYFGNDLLDAYRVAYSLKFWAGLRRPGLTDGPVQDWPALNAQRKGLKRWLRRHSVVYGMASLTLGPPLRLLMWKFGLDMPTEATAVRDQDGRILSLLSPSSRSNQLDLSDPSVEEGMRLTLDALEAMRVICEENDIRLTVVLIPTKISVLGEYGRDTLGDSQEDLIDLVIERETLAMERARRWLDGRGIDHVNALDQLRNRVGQEALYPLDSDGHPTIGGHRVIAEVVSQAIRQRER